MGSLGQQQTSSSGFSPKLISLEKNGKGGEKLEMYLQVHEEICSGRESSYVPSLVLAPCDCRERSF